MFILINKFFFLFILNICTIYNKVIKKTTIRGPLIHVENEHLISYFCTEIMNFVSISWSYIRDIVPTDLLFEQKICLKPASGCNFPFNWLLYLLSTIILEFYLTYLEISLTFSDT